MRIQKKSTLPDPKRTDIQDVARNIDSDITAVFQAVNGNLRFGSSGSGTNGENIAGQWVTFSTTTANTEVAVTHSMGAIPVGFIVTNINVGGVVYTSGTAWTTTKVYFKCSAATATITIFLLR
jgi:hypothetical protein